MRLRVTQVLSFTLWQRHKALLLTQFSVQLKSNNPFFFNYTIFFLYTHLLFLLAFL